MLGTTTTDATSTAKYGVKFLFKQSIGIAVPLCLYSITSFMFYPIFQSLVYQKVCEQYAGQIAIGINCSDHKSTSSNAQLQAKANWILLLSSVAMCSVGIFTSALVGRLGDIKSRKMALLIPLFGVLLEDITLMVQSHYMDLSVYWLVGSEVLFASFGGYMSIFSTFFAYATDSVNDCPPKCRSQIIAILEGVIGLGGTTGYACSFLLKILGFTGVFTGFALVYIICILAVFALPSISRSSTGSSRSGTDLFGIQLIKSVLRHEEICSFLALLIAFAVSYFTFIGSTHILFYYLKFRFDWDAGLFGFLKGPAQGLATVNALFVYPFLREHNVTDRTLALVGLISRTLGRLWLAVTWNTASAFFLIFFDSFTRFAASGMRAIMANIVPAENHGSMFALLAVTEAFCNLLAALIFHTVFPLSLGFLPQISFYILAALMLIPVTILWAQAEAKITQESLVSPADNTNESELNSTTIQPIR